MFIVTTARSITGEGVVTGLAGAMTVAALLTGLEDYGRWPSVKVVQKFGAGNIFKVFLLEVSYAHQGCNY